ncbi:MAG TPA: hypothetical protein PKA84_01405 [Rubrivivax sp.]|nr:hypothetical protein [Rubrivivax sp.]HMR68866.1 hypothetical protein [Rubrivivax sp.]
MIITKRYAQRLIRAGKASLDGSAYSDGKTYAVIVRHDLLRVDHYLVGYGDLR